MSNWEKMFIFAIAMILAVPAMAACPDQPKDGVYSTSNGTMIGGRASEAWCAGGPGRPGDAENAMSWDGANLGSQWTMWGMTIDASGAVETGRHIDANGNGWIDYQTNYTGGQFWMSGSHIWGNGTGDFTGTVTYYNVGARVNYLRGAAIGVTSNVYLTGTFDNCPDCSIEYAISNALSVWQTGAPGTMPGNYPAFLCGATQGELYDVCCAVMKVYCNMIATKTSTWGMIKELYR